MKKNLLLVLGLSLAVGANAQNGTTKFHGFAEKTNSVKVGGQTFPAVSEKNSNNGFVAKAGGDVIWSEDFENATATGWTFDNAGVTGTDKGWATVTTSRTWGNPYGVAKKMNAPATGKFLDGMNGSYNSGNPTSSTGVTFYAISPKITVPNKNVTINFLQYGALFNDGQWVEVSSDSLNWEVVFTNNDRTPYTGASTSDIYKNPELISANVGATGIADNTFIYVRFKLSKNDKFTGTGPMNYLTWGWMIDNMTVTENYGSDLKELSPYVSSAGIRYSKIPASQKHDVSIVNPLANNGFSTLSDVKSVVKVTSPTSTYNDTINGNAALIAYSNDTIKHTISLNADFGTYTVSNFKGIFNGTDELTSNDTTDYSYSFDFGGTVYALDLGGTPTSYEIEPANAEFRVGNLFDIYADTKMTGVDVYLYATGSLKSAVGTEIYVALRDPNTASTDIIAQSPLYTLDGSENNKWITLVFESPVDVYTGKTYLVTAETYGSGATSGQDMVVGASGTGLPGTSIAFYASENSTNWYRAGKTPMVRMNLTPGLVSTSKLDGTVKVNLYPNPAKDAVVVDYNTAFAGDVTISIVDLAGKTVYNNTVANQEAGNNKAELNVSNLTSGIYQVVINANNSTITKKLVIK